VHNPGCADTPDRFDPVTPAEDDSGSGNCQHPKSGESGYPLPLHPPPYPPGPESNSPASSRPRPQEICWPCAETIIYSLLNRERDPVAAKFKNHLVVPARPVSLPDGSESLQSELVLSKRLTGREYSQPYPKARSRRMAFGRSDAVRKCANG